jgi:RNA polymerase sigma factor (TIGR02999 family)
VVQPSCRPPLPRSEAAPERLFELLYDQLHGLAGRVRHGRAGATMSTTALVHEAYIKLASAGEVDLQSRLHFFRLAARAMRQVLVDAARRKVAEKRGGDVVSVTFDDALHATPMRM